MRPPAPDAKSFAKAIGTEYKTCRLAQRHWERCASDGLTTAPSLVIKWKSAAHQWAIVAACWKMGYFHGAQ
jgi:hypothetical protein